MGVYESKWARRDWPWQAGSGDQLVGHAQEQQQEKRITATLQYQFQCCAIMVGGLFWNVGSKLCTIPLAAWDT